MRRPLTKAWLLLAAVLASQPSVARAQQPPAAQAPGAQDTPEDASPVPPDAVLVIDGQPISGAEYGMWLIATQGEKLARQYAHGTWVVNREARRLDIEVTDEEVAAKVEEDFATRIAGAFLGNRADWLAEVARTGRSEAGLRRHREVEYRPQLQAAAIADIDRVVPPGKIERDWQARYGRKGRAYDLRLIYFKVIVTTQPDMDRSAWQEEDNRRKQAELERARQVQARALAGEDFGKLALEHSMDPETRDRRGAPKGGFKPTGWPERFLLALDDLAPGDISEPLYARGGWWLVQVKDIQVTPLESVRAEIEADLAARGPEPDEVGAVMYRLADGVDVRVLPSMYSARDDGEWPSAYEPALEIDGEPVRRGDYARWILHTRGEIWAPQFVMEWVVRKRAEAQGISVDEKEVLERARERMEWLFQSGGKSREAWIAYLAIGGRTEDSFLRDLAWRARSDLLAEKMMMRERKVTAQDVRARYDDVYGKDGVRTEVALIRVPIDLEPPSTELSRDELTQHFDRKTEEARQLALKIVERISKGEDFGALAREYSADLETKEQGGRLPERFRADTWTADVGQAVTPLAPGETSEPLFFGTAWLIFQKTSERKVAFEDVEAELRKELETMRPATIDVAAWKNVLSKSARYEVLPPMYSD